MLPVLRFDGGYVRGPLTERDHVCVRQGSDEDRQCQNDMFHVAVHERKMGLENAPGDAAKVRNACPKQGREDFYRTSHGNKGPTGLVLQFLIVRLISGFMLCRRTPVLNRCTSSSTFKLCGYTA